MAADIAHFAVKSIGLSAVNGRKPCTLLNAARHNLRELQAESGATAGIDPARTQDNIVLQGPASAAEVETLAASLLSRDGLSTNKLRRDHCQAIEAVFSLPPDTPVEFMGYFTSCLAWLKRSMQLPVLSAVVHRDESTVHMHVLLLPSNRGAHVGSAPIGREALKNLRADFFDKVAGPAGMQRTGAKVRGMVKQWAILAVMQRCEALGLPTANGLLWPFVVDAIKGDPTPAMLALGIDANTIRPPSSHPTPEPASNPIGIAESPIGIEKPGATRRTLSCVGIEAQAPSVAPAKNAECSHLATQARRAERMRVAMEAEQLAIAKKANKAAKYMPAPALRTDDDGTTRERDEHAHDTSGWEM